jgi:hypothetical protein
MPDYGTPKANDAPARVETQMNSVDARIKAAQEKMAPSYARAIGSQPVPPQEEFMEYIAVAGTPEERTAHFAELASQWKQQGFTFAEAVEMALQYEKRNEARLGKYDASL